LVPANGVLGKDIPYTMVKTKTKTLGAHHSIVKELNDTIFDRYTDIQYVYNRKLKKNGDTILSHYINLGGSYDEFYHSSDRSRKLTIELMEKGDSTEAYVDVYRLKKLPNSKWVSKFGLPMGGREFHVYLENCSRDSFMLEQINDDGSNLTSVILKHYMRLHKKHPDFWRMISWVNLEKEPFYKCLKNIKDDSYRKLSVYYRKGQENGNLKKDLSFEDYMFFLFAVTYFYHSNRKTLSNTLNTELFTAQGADRITNKCITILSNTEK